jgi:hypothetical protein
MPRAQLRYLLTAHIRQAVGALTKIDPLSPAILALSQSKARERNEPAIEPPCKEVADMGDKITISNPHSSHGLNSS